MSALICGFCYWLSCLYICDRLRQKSWSPSSVSCVAARKIVRRSCLGTRPRYNLVVDESRYSIMSNFNLWQTILVVTLKETMHSILNDAKVLISTAVEVRLKFHGWSYSAQACQSKRTNLPFDANVF